MLFYPFFHTACFLRSFTTAFVNILSEIFVKVGDKINIGQELGRMGSTGRSTGPHLDWRMEVRGIRIDPQLLIK